MLHQGSIWLDLQPHELASAGSVRSTALGSRAKAQRILASLGVKFSTCSPVPSGKSVGRTGLQQTKTVGRVDLRTSGMRAVSAFLPCEAGNPIREWRIKKWRIKTSQTQL